MEDGTYEGIVVDAAPAGVDTGAADEPLLAVEIAISTGRHKGEVVRVRGHFPGRTDLDLLAAPVTLVVAAGEPTVTLDR